MNLPMDVGNRSFSRLVSPLQEEAMTSKAVALDIQALAQHRQNPLESFKPRSGQQALEELRGVNELATAKPPSRRLRRSADGCWPRRMLDQVRGVLGMA
jgi:hypothetical protein